jgi:hypothetical protein
MYGGSGEGYASRDREHAEGKAKCLPILSIRDRGSASERDKGSTPVDAGADVIESSIVETA